MTFGTSQTIHSWNLNNHAVWPWHWTQTNHPQNFHIHVWPWHWTQTNHPQNFHKCDLDIELKQTTHRISTFMCDLDIQLKPPTELNSQQIRVIDLWLYPAWKVAYLSCGTWIDTRIHILVLLPHHGLLLFVKWHVRQVHVIIPTRH
jgi:hypothetical protein